LGKSIVAKSWSHLNKVLYDIKLTKHNRYRSDYVYRGMANKAWDLQTSLQRFAPNHFANIEGPILRNFEKYAKEGSFPANSLFVKLAVAQHHGLPTRVLDWTTSPKVAAHFAIDDANMNYDGIIWRIDAAAARRFLPEKLHKILEDNDAFFFSVDMLKNFSSLSEFDADSPNKDFVVFFEPPSLDDRIINQAAVLSVLPDSTRHLMDLLKTKKFNDLYDRIIIPAKIKWEVRDKLDQDNISERMLFPGLDGTSLWLKRYYGPGPNAKKA
jgi:FRG domain